MSSVSQAIHANLAQLKPLPTRTSSGAKLPNLLLDARQIAPHFTSYDTYLFDCDGVLYRSSSPIPHAADAVSELLDLGKRVLFVTNSSGRSRSSMRDKLAETLGLPGLTAEQMVPSCFAAATYMRAHHPGVRKAYVIGGGGIADELSAVGVSCLGGADESGLSADFSESDIESYDVDPSVGAVVVGMDSGFTYAKIAKAALYLRDPKVVFIATNKDAFDVMPSGRPQPAGGVMAAAIEHASGRVATLVGKPSKILGDMLESGLGVDLSASLFVGDRMDTDIEFGYNNGCDTCLVLSGCTTGNDVNGFAAEGGTGRPLPTIIIPSLGHFSTKFSSNL